MMDRRTALRKSIHVFEGLRQMLSKSENGMVPDEGCKDSFQAIDETVMVLKGMLREELGGRQQKEPELRDWQKEIMENGTPGRLTL